jgi:hypothetical protein
MRQQSHPRLAEVFRRTAVRRPGRQARDRSSTAAEHGAQFPETGPFAEALFRQEGTRFLQEGYVFKPHPNLRGSREDRSDWGYWACDLKDHDRLTWSEQVYDLFGLPVGAHVDRDWAVTRYAAQSRSALQRVRDFALRHACGFVLDAEIEPEGANSRWIRVLALPEFQDGLIVRLHGLKRML